MRFRVTLVCIECPRGWEETVEWLDDTSKRCFACGEETQIRGVYAVQSIRGEDQHGKDA